MSDGFWLPVNDAVTSVIWLLANWLLILASVKLSNRFFPSDQGAAKVLNVAIIACAILTAILQILGMAGMFIGGLMIGGVLIVSILTLSWTGKRDSSGCERPTGEMVSSFWLLLFALLCGHCLVNGLLKVPTDFDCLMYHLPLIDSWLQSASLYSPDCSHWSNPGGSELLAAWSCGPFSGDFLAPLNNLPVVIIWASATLQFCRMLGMTHHWPELATLSAMSVYATLHQTDDASNDLIVAALFMASNVYLLRFLEAPHLPSQVMLGICCGLLCGVKFFALGYAAVTCFTLVGALAVTVNWHTALRAAISTVTLILVFGGYWYIRNIVYTGLPLYPMGDTQSLAYPNLWETSLIGNSHPRLWSLFLQAVWMAGGPIHWLAALALPCTVLGVIWRTYFRSKDASAHRMISSCISVVLLMGAAAVLWVTPYLVEDQPGSLNHLRWAYTPARYGLCFLTMSVVCLFSVINDFVAKMASAGQSAAFFAISLILVYQWVLRIQSEPEEFAHLYSGLIGMDIGLVMFGVRWLTQITRRSRFLRDFPGVAIIGLLTVGIGVLSSKWHDEYDRHFDSFFKTTAFTTLKRSEFDDARILVLDYRPYAYFGSRRQHRVINPRLYVSDEWLISLSESTDLRFIAAFGLSGYTVDRYRGAYKFLKSRHRRFREFINSQQVVVVENRAD